ncbi:putative bifunctional diguanylate cyclase/phosphodiesterase [Qipengyuania sp.]|uniref:putative bifunctional diguanylate cyclase/phosphodiesterase n=1 Tax=Qipengyuania sp. TaxID=2004515 RepID=UPI0035C84C5D
MSAGQSDNDAPKWRHAALTTAAAAIAACALWLTGMLSPFERALQSTFFATHSSDASGQVVLVEMDAASLAAIRRWPWDRRHYAAVVDRLSAAGARSIAFDVDLSTGSHAVADRALASSFARSDSQIILPTFSQRASHADVRMLDSLPIPAFRESATLASVSVVPDIDGQVRRMPLGTVTADIPRPALSAQIAQRGGTAGQAFPLDLSLRLSTIPRLSFIDVERGEFAGASVAGKDVLIGATAVEMGDRYAVSGYGVIPGVLIQAMAAETLMAGVPMETDGLAMLIVALGLCMWIARTPRKADVFAKFVFATVALAGVMLAGWMFLRVLMGMAPALAAICAATGLRLLVIYRQEQAFRHTHDLETGLPNRHAMARPQPGDEFTIVAAIGNLDRLQAVLGPEGAAQAVRGIADRIAVARGGRCIYRVEEKSLAWIHTFNDGQPEAVLPDLAELLRQPVEIAGRPVDAQIAFGIAAAGFTSEATLAASEALRTGEHWHYHEAAERAALEQQISLMGELDTAIALGQLEVVYQPKLHLSSDTIDAVEALVRWNHPERGYLRPDTFIPLAETADRIDDLTLYVLRRTIDDLSDWCARGLVLHAAVNISARLLSNPRFIAATEALLAGTGVPRTRLIFEVTESAAFLDAGLATEALQSFHEMGVAISMDDYGTGQSTLSYLKRLPLSELKIDRSFVQFAHRERSDGLMVRSTVDLAHELGLRVVAEGVEDAECMAFLRSIGCDYIQGYLIGKPMSALDLAEMLERGFKQAA